MPRKLSEHEKLLWQRVMTTVQPLPGKPVVVPAKQGALPTVAVKKKIALPPGPAIETTKPLPPKRPASAPIPAALDGTWERRFGRGSITPDMSIDLHGSGLAQAYARLDHKLEQAISQGSRVILLVTGHIRSHDRTSGKGRGAIAAVVRDWLAASRHARNIVAVRNAHPRHGGAGALYIVLKR